MVIPVPLTALVERNEEEIGALDLAENSCRVSCSRDGVAERRTHAFENRGLEEKRAMLIGPGGEHDLGQVVDDVAVRAAELHEGLCGIDRVPNRKEREMQARGPALGAPLESRDR